MKDLILFKPPTYKPTNYTQSTNITKKAIGLSGFAINGQTNTDNKIQKAVGSSPPKFNPSASNFTDFRNARLIYKEDAGGGQNYYPASSYIQLKKINAIGQASTKTGLNQNSPFSFNGLGPVINNNKLQQSSTKSTLKKVRGGGCVAPAKKGSIDNKASSANSNMLSGGWGFNRQIKA